MKKLAVSLFKYHLIPILIAGMLASCVFVLYVKTKPLRYDAETRIVVGKQAAMRGTFANFPTNQIELELAGSLSNPNTITVLGSSEMGEILQYSPYYFLPDSLNMPVVGFGHAYHQDFSIFCELLAMESQIKNSKICIILSPGWFETDGTNTEAFLEFARPNFLKSIIYNDRIPLESKMEIGRFVSAHYDEIDQPAEYINYFKKLYQTRNIPLLNEEMAENKGGIANVSYAVSTAEKPVKPTKNIDWNATEKRIQQAFTAAIKTNRLYVSDVYFKDVLLKDGDVKKGKTEEIDPPSKNREFQDFLLLVALLKKYNCDATFVIQPLNPYHYDGLENYNEIVASLEKVLRKNQFPYLNLFVTDKKKYEPGTLNDVMHLGDYGWIKVNRFLYENYK